MKVFQSKANKDRVLDYSLLLLSLAGLLVGYELVLGCGGSTPPAARFQVIDDNEKDNLGRLELTESDPCTTVRLSNDTALNGEKDCPSCGLITWEVNFVPAGNDATLTRGENFTDVQICRGAMASAGKSSSVILKGSYEFLSGIGTKTATITRRIPARVADGS